MSQTVWCQGRFVGATALLPFAQRLAERLRPGDTVGLAGPMGAGKTTLCRAVCAALGVDVHEAFGSPTYAYANTYTARLGPVTHIDLYRIDAIEQAHALGVADAIGEASAVTLVEWADKWPALLPVNALHVALSVAWQRPDERDYVLTGPTTHRLAQCAWPS